jgi:hypothetical protein
VKVLLAIVIAEGGGALVKFCPLMGQDEGLTVLTQKSNLRSILTPYDVLHWGGVKLGDGLLLLNVIEHNRTCRAEDEASSSAVEDLIRLNRRFYALDHSPGQIANLNKLL